MKRSDRVESVTGMRGVVLRVDGDTAVIKWVNGEVSPTMPLRLIRRATSEE